MFNIINKMFDVEDWQQLLIFLALSAVVYGVFHIVSVALLKYAPRFFQFILRLKNENVEKALAHSFAKPIAIFLRCTGILFAVQILPFTPSVNSVISPVMSTVMRIILIVSVGSAAQNFVVNIPVFFDNISRKHPALTPTLLSFFTKVLQALIIALTVVIILKELGYDVNGLIAGLGLSGLTFALAAQDTASNFVSGLVILADKPFGVGDWISVAGMEGIVEEMNFRSCRIRTFDNALISVPNSKISGDSVTNWTKMNLRKTNITIGLLYSTSKQTMQTVCDQIRRQLKQMPEIKTDSILVRFDKFSRSSLDITVSYNSYPIPAAQHFALKEKVQYIIMDIVAANDTDFAFNSLTVYNAEPAEQ